MIAAERVVVLRALKLGDLLCTVPALRALRAGLPGAEIRLVGLPWAVELVKRYDNYLDGLFELPGYPGLPEAPFDARAFSRFLAEVQSWEPELVLQLHGSGDRSNPLAMLLGGRLTAGFYVPGSYCPDPQYFIPYPTDLPEVGRHLRLLEHLGLPARGLHKEFPLRAADWQALAEILTDSPERGSLPRRSYAVLHPGAGAPERCWPPERFAAVADQLARLGLSVVLTGSASEAGLTAAVRAAMASPCLDLTGRTSLGALAALLSNAALLVANDTGLMHLAESTRTPLVAVSFDPESWRWAPLNSSRYRVLRGGYAVSSADVVSTATRLLCSRPGVCRLDPNGAGQTPDVGVGSN